MFAYCGNNPVNRIDPTGYAFWTVVGLVVVLAAVLFIPSSVDQTPYKEQAAREIYNPDTVNVYIEDIGEPEDDMLNVEIYVADKEKDYQNIQIEDSLSIDSIYEMEAVIDVVIDSDYYSEDRFGTKDFMVAQWVAHNACHDIATGSKLGYYMMARISGADDPIISSQKLDIRNIGNMGRGAEIIYKTIAWALP